MRRAVISLILAAVLTPAAPPGALSVKRKIDLIQTGRAPRGSKVTLSRDELNAYVRSELRTVAPEGVRDPRLDLGDNRATGYAYIDFPKLQQSQGRPMNWLLAKLLEGERPVRVDARIQSGGGKATVHVDRVEVSGVSISGGALDYLIRNYLWSYYPEAKVNRPFELAHRIDRLEVQPAQVNVVIGK
ncbi:MAG: hypothetical protein ACM336_07225 [Acidobacteriota bacterium]